MRTMHLNLKRKREIPRPSVARLCKLFWLLDEMRDQQDVSISSREIGSRLGIAHHTVRKDISYLGDAGCAGAGYNAEKLKLRISSALGLSIERKACIAGLNPLGTALLTNSALITKGFTIVAGFDTSINRLETISTTVPLYPTYDIVSVVSRNSIELAILTVQDQNAAEIGERLMEGGVRGIINFSPVVLQSTRTDVYISNMDIAGEFRYLSALFSLAPDMHKQEK
jgi:redox-sensing transcriptional repressor